MPLQFNEQEVELLISGTPDIDVDEWRAATEYHGYTGSDPVIVWWWRALKSFNREERAKVLSFATGTSRVPLGGFGELQGVQGVQKFSIHRAYGTPDRLPQAHTCQSTPHRYNHRQFANILIPQASIKSTSQSSRRTKDCGSNYFLRSTKVERASGLHEADAGMNDKW